MAAAFPSHHEALANAERIADDCGDIELDLGHWILPRVAVPGGQTPSQHLAQLAWAGFERHYGGRPEHARARRIQQIS